MDPINHDESEMKSVLAPTSAELYQRLALQYHEKTGDQCPSLQYQVHWAYSKPKGEWRTGGSRSQRASA